MKLFNTSDYIEQLSIDSVVFGYKDKELKVLVSKINFEGDFWSLPGGFIFKEESTDLAAARILEERTGLSNIFLEQYKVFGEEGRNNRTLFEKFFELVDNEVFSKEALEWLSKRFVSIGYYALVEIDEAKLQKGALDEFVVWIDYKKLPNLIMDHNLMVEQALETLRQNFDRKLIGFNLLPETFTMRELRELYETVYDKPFARNNFQKKILDLDVLERLEKQYTGAANKAPYLYRFRS